MRRPPNLAWLTLSKIGSLLQDQQMSRIVDDCCGHEMTFLATKRTSKSSRSQSQEGYKRDCKNRNENVRMTVMFDILGMMKMMTTTTTTTTMNEDHDMRQKPETSRSLRLRVMVPFSSPSLIYLRQLSSTKLFSVLLWWAWIICDLVQKKRDDVCCCRCSRSKRPTTSLFVDRNRENCSESQRHFLKLGEFFYAVVLTAKESSSTGAKEPWSRPLLHCQMRWSKNMPSIYR
jgi:hypothetical protein